MYIGEREVIKRYIGIREVIGGYIGSKAMPLDIIPLSARSNLLVYLDASRTDRSAVTAWTDRSGNSRNAALSNFAGTAESGWTTTKPYALSLDGVDDYGEIADTPETRLTTGGTLMAWIYPKSLGGEDFGIIIDKSTATLGRNGYTFYIGSGNALRFRTNILEVILSSENAISFNTWQHVVVVFSSSGRKLYFNGVEDTGATGTAPTALSPDISGVVRIGSRAFDTNRVFDGYIDRPMIFDRALTEAEVQYIYNRTKGGYGL